MPHVGLPAARGPRGGHGKWVAWCRQGRITGRNAPGCTPGRRRRTKGRIFGRGLHGHWLESDARADAWWHSQRPPGRRKSAERRALLRHSEGAPAKCGPPAASSAAELSKSHALLLDLLEALVKARRRAALHPSKSETLLVAMARRPRPLPRHGAGYRATAGASRRPKAGPLKAQLHQDPTKAGGRDRG